MPSLDSLRTFLAVYRAGAITAAAELLGVSQPTVTAQIKALEAATGRPLFDRLPRGVVPTAAAHALARRVGDPLDAVEAAMLDITGARPEAPVHLGGPAEFLSELALPALAGLVAAGHRVHAAFGLPDDLQDDLMSGRLDLVVSSTRPKRRGLLVDPLYDEQFVLVAAPAWADRVARPVEPESLREVPLVAYADEAPILRRYWRTVFGARLARAPELVVADLRAVLAAVVAGAGASVLPVYLCRRHLTSGALRALLDPKVPPLNTLYLASRPSTVTRPPVAAVRSRLLVAMIEASLKA